jgi:hypothetical protein
MFRRISKYRFLAAAHLEIRRRVANTVLVPLFGGEPELRRVGPRRRGGTVSTLEQIRTSHWGDTTYVLALLKTFYGKYGSSPSGGCMSAGPFCGATSVHMMPNPLACGDELNVLGPHCRDRYIYT